MGTKGRERERMQESKNEVHTGDIKQSVNLWRSGINDVYSKNIHNSAKTIDDNDNDGYDVIAEEQNSLLQKVSIVHEFVSHSIHMKCENVAKRLLSAGQCSVPQNAIQLCSQTKFWLQTDISQQIKDGLIFTLKLWVDLCVPCALHLIILRLILNASIIQFVYLWLRIRIHIYVNKHIHTPTPKMEDTFSCSIPKYPSGALWCSNKRLHSKYLVGKWDSKVYYTFKMLKEPISSQPNQTGWIIVSWQIWARVVGALNATKAIE